MMEDIYETRERVRKTVINDVINDQSHPYVLVEHAATYLNDQPAHIYYLIRKKRLDALRHQGRILITTASLRRYRTAREQP